MKTPFLLAALAALALPAAADQTVTFITGTIDSLEAEGDPPAIEMKDGRFLVRFRTRRAGVTYTLVSSAVLTREDAAWKPVTGDKTAAVSTAAAETGDGELIELSAPVPDDQPVQFYRIRASW